MEAGRAREPYALLSFTGGCSTVWTLSGREVKMDWRDCRDFILGIVVLTKLLLIKEKCSLNDLFPPREFFSNLFRSDDDCCSDKVVHVFRLFATSAR